MFSSNYMEPSQVHQVDVQCFIQLEGGKGGTLKTLCAFFDGMTHSQHRFPRRALFCASCA